MYKVKTYADPKFSAGGNEAITYDFYDGQDVFKCGFHDFFHCLPDMKNHHLELMVQWYDNCFFSESPLRLNAGIYRMLNIKLKNTSMLTDSKVYFITEDDPEWNEDKSVSFTLRPQDTFHYEYSLDMTANPGWKGTIRQLKFCPLSAPASFAGFKGKLGTLLSYDYIQLAAERVRPAVNFVFRYDPEGFTASEGCEITADQYILNTAAGKGGEWIQSPARLNLDISVYRYVKLRYKNISDARQGWMQAITDSDDGYDTARRLVFDLAPGDSGFVEYTLDLGTSGTLVQCRFGLTGDMPGRCEVDYIVFDSVRPEEAVLPGRVIGCGQPGAYAQWNGLAADTTLLKYLRIQMTNSTWSRNAWVQWITADDAVYDEKKRQRFRIDPQHDEVREYAVGLRQNQYWNGKVTGLRLVPADELPQGECRVEQVKICESADTTAQNRHVVEGALDLCGTTPTGWTLHRGGGEYYGYVDADNVWSNAINLEEDRSLRAGAFRLVGVAGEGPWMTKEITRQTDGFTEWDISFQIDNPAAGCCWQLLDGERVAVEICVRDGALWTGTQKLACITAMAWFDVLVLVCTGDGTFSVKVNGVPSGTGVMSAAAFDTVCVRIPDDRAVRLCGANNMYRVGYLRESFFGCGGMIIQDDRFNVANRCLTLKKQSDGESGDYRMPFLCPADGLVEFETDFLVMDLGTCVEFRLWSGQETAAAVRLEGGSILACGSGGNTVLWERYKADVWYNLIVIVNTVTGRAEFRVNGHRNHKNIAVHAGTLTALSLSADCDSPAQLRLQGLRAAPFMHSTTPYIDKVPSKTGLVGMLAWFLLTGFWGRVCNQFTISDKTPYLGYYDDQNLECVEWQVKFMAEHAVDFVVPFFYGNMGAPVNNGVHMTSTFLRHSEQVDKLKLCVCCGEIFETVKHDNVINHLMPYFIENFFKHDSYLKIDNKPVLFTYSWATIVRDLGEEGTAALFEEMRRQCVQEGFDGLIILGERRANGLEGDLPDLTGAKATQIDGLFAYSNNFTPESQTAYRDNGEKQGLRMVMSPGCGWDNRYWVGAGGGYFILHSTPAFFESCLRVIREEQWEKRPGSYAGSLDGMVMLDNWSEFGEGHSIQPSNLYGLGYLNAVRKAFSDAEEAHTDTVPEGAFNALNIQPTRRLYETGVPVHWLRYPMPKPYEDKI